MNIQIYLPWKNSNFGQNIFDGIQIFKYLSLTDIPTEFFFFFVAFLSYVWPPVSLSTQSTWLKGTPIKPTQVPSIISFIPPLGVFSLQVAMFICMFFSVFVCLGRHLHYSRNVRIIQGWTYYDYDDDDKDKTTIVQGQCQ